MPNYIQLLKLEGHEEGGYFSVFYKSEDKVAPLSKRYNQTSLENQLNERNAISSIYFLLEKQGFSAWHRLKSDEIWHYYDGGSPIDIHVIADGELTTYILGNPGITENASFQIVIKAGVWFAAEVRHKSSFGLVGCTVSPAFEYEDFELAEAHRDELIQKHPHLQPMIDKFIKPNVMKANSNNNLIDHSSNSHVENKLSAKDYIKNFKLQAHQEGGYFCVNYQAKDMVTSLTKRYQEFNEKLNQSSIALQRFAGSAIYYLLNKNDFSAWHKLKSDEIWHYYDGGSPIDIYTIEENGELKKIVLGNPLITENASFQAAIKAGFWFAAEVRDKSSFALVGCTVSPGFAYQDFILANRKDLIAKYPIHESVINRLTRVEPTSWKSPTITYATLALISGMGLYALAKTEVISNYINELKNKLSM